MIATRAAGQALLPAAGTLDADASPPEEHVWFVLDVRDDTSALLHVPPGSRKFGAANLAARLVRRPAALAAHGRDAFLCFPATREPDGSTRRQVLGTSTIPMRATGEWHYANSTRLKPLASIPGEGSLLSFGATDAGLHALLHRSSGPELLVLQNQSWRAIELPPDLMASAGDPARLRLLTGGGTLTLADLHDTASPRLWVRRASGPTDTLGWTRASAALEQAIAGVGDALLAELTDSRFVWAEPAGDSKARLLVADELGRFDLGTHELAGDEIALIATGARAGILLLSRARDQDGGFGHVRLERISIATGRTLNEADVETQGPISRSQITFVLMLLSAVLMLILAFVFWPEDISVPPLPPAYVLAPSGARLIAGAIDYVLGAVPAALIMGVPVMDVLLPHLERDPFEPLGAALLGLGFAAAHATMGEWLFGRSIGKAMIGLKVLGLRDGCLGRPRLWQAGVRNAVKWSVLPVALAGLTYARRHIGDLAGSTVVVTGALPDDSAEH